MDQQQPTERVQPEFSILIGRVSSEDSERIMETLEAIRQQHGQHHYEVIIAERREDEISAKIDSDFSEVQRIPCPHEMALPAMHTLALGQARGAYIIVTEDHCVPAPDWLNGIAQAFREAPAGTVAVGGCIENGVGDTALDWATFLCEYHQFLEPVAEGPSSVLAGNNTAYHHSVFTHFDDALLCSGFWETTMHPVLIKQGYKFYSSNKIRLYHCKKFSFGLFIRQRFSYSRYYAGRRFSHAQFIQRILACGATLLLPPLLLYRNYRQLRCKQRLGREFRSAVPLLIVFYMVWACGEMAGYAFGSGHALSRIE